MPQSELICSPYKASELISVFTLFSMTAGWGRIVNMSSQMAVISGPGKAPYSAAKAGLVGLTKVSVYLFIFLFIIKYEMF